MSRRLRKTRRGPLVLEEVREKDPEGRIVLHHRVVDTLARMRQAGTIDAAMLDAGREFQRSFILAQLDPLPAMDLLRVPGSGREPEPGHVQEAARHRVHRALLALGVPTTARRPAPGPSSWPRGRRSAGPWLPQRPSAAC